MTNTDLPIDAAIGDIVEAIKTHRTVVVWAPPGTGKSTRVPLAIRDRLNPNGDIRVVQPRRIAARNLATYVASLDGGTVGQSVGYEVRFDRKISPKTDIRFVTDGLLLRQMIDDPFLESTSVVILDEFHERSVQSDLLAAFLKDLQSVRDDLSVVVMSATLQSEKVSAYFNAPSIVVEAPIFPLEIVHRESPLDYRDLTGGVMNTLNDAMKLSGDILVFLPGARDIENAASTCRTRFPDVDTRVLYGSMEGDAQSAALSPSTKRRIIFSTNIAETSLTVPGVSIVIDSGWEKVNAFDPTTGFDHLELKRISEASATQRAGRAAREKPGTAFRLWTSAEAFRMPPFRLPEIARTDPSRAALEVAAWCRHDPSEFDWYERPNAGAFQNALRELRNIEALDNDCTITPTGESLLSYPLPPRLAKLVDVGRGRGLLQEAALCATILSERDTWTAPKVAESKSDVVFRADQLVRSRRLSAFKTATQIAGTKTLVMNAPEDQIRRLLFDVFLDKLAIKRSESRYAMVGAGSVALRTNVKDEFVLALRVHGNANVDGVSTGLCWLASVVEPAWVDEVAMSAIEVEFDPSNETVSVFEIRSVHDLEISRTRTALSDASEEAIQHAFLKQVNKDVSRAFTLDDKAAQFVARHTRAFGTSPFENEDVVRALVGSKRSFRETRKLRVENELKKLLTYAQKKTLDSECPATIAVPSGKSRAIDYTVEPPVLAVRIQELFGWTETPTVGRDRTRLRLHLLAPNYRPAQITDDLQSFWENTYPEVRKELRARYPKHDWPEDPLTAKAKAK